MATATKFWLKLSQSEHDLDLSCGQPQQFKILTVVTHEHFHRIKIKPTPCLARRKLVLRRGTETQ
jgi:hypothetical protein